MPHVRICYAALLVVVALSSACSTSDDLTVVGSSPDGPALALVGVPAIAELDALRSLSALTTQVLLGVDNYLQSPGAQASGTDLVLDATASGPGGGTDFEWAIWGFNAGDTPVDIQAALDAPSATGCWIGLANYGADRWQWHGPYTTSQILSLSTGSWVSPGDQVYCAVVAAQGSAITVVSVTYQSDAAAQSGQILDGDGGTGYDTSMALVDGNPAIAYYDNELGRLRFIRASAPDGSSWALPLTLDQSADVGRFPSLAVVDGFPAISYFDVENETLKYIRATDATGSLWGIGQTIDATDFCGEFTSLVVVNGRPAITYYSFGGGVVRYLRASDATGAAWPSAGVIVEFVAYPDGASKVEGTSQAVVNGKPAVVYFSYLDSQSYYRQADDIDGSSWLTPHVEFDGTNEQQQFTALAVVDGMPVICFRDVFASALCLCRATEANGFSWAERQVLDNTADSGYMPSITIVDGNPAISYYEDLGAGNLRYIRATNASGTAWSSGQTLDGPGDVGAYSSLIQLGGGGPAVSYLDVGLGDLRYIAGF